MKTCCAAVVATMLGAVMFALPADARANPAMLNALHLHMHAIAKMTAISERCRSSTIPTTIVVVQRKPALSRTK
jgi:hypothetical protein